MRHYDRIPIPLLLLLIIVLFARSVAQDDLIPLPTDESTADLDLTPLFITETPIVETTPIITDPLTLITPLDSTTTILSWTAHPDAVMYRVIFSREGQTVLRVRVNPMMCVDGICTLDLQSHPRAVSLQRGARYRWQVIAVTTETQSRSIHARFRLAQTAHPTVFQLVAPATGAIVPDFPVFEWQTVVGATHYRLLFEREGVSYGRFDFNATDCLADLCRLESVFYPFMPPFDFPYTYTWSILAYTPQETISSERWSFSIARAEFNPPVSDASAWIEPDNAIGGSDLVIYSDHATGLRRLNLTLPNTDPGFDRLILERNGDTVLFGFGIIRSPVIRPNTRTIAFVGGRSTEYGTGLVTWARYIWLIDSNGNNVRRFLSDGTGGEGTLAWSYDGSKLAADYYDLYAQMPYINVYDFSSRRVLLTLENARLPMWSRDNQTLAYITPDHRILAYSFRDRSITQLAGANSTGISYPDWYTANGRNEFVFVNRYGVWRLFHNPVSGNQLFLLTSSRDPAINPDGTYTDFTPVWSPNGNQILIRRQYHNRTDYPIGLGVINADGSGFTEINRPNSYLRNDQWGRDWENTGSFQIATATPLVKPTLGPPTPTPTTTPISTPVTGLCSVQLLNIQLSLRLSPTPYSPKLATIPANTTLTASYRLDVEGQDIWYQVEYNGQVGWIAARITGIVYVNNANCQIPAPYPPEWPSIAQVTATEIPVNCDLDAYLRSEPIALVLARLAYAEAGTFNITANGENFGGVVFSDALRIAWIARLNAFLGLPNYSIGIAGDSVPIIDQILAPNAFEPITQLNQKLPTVNCDPQNFSNLIDPTIRKMLFPENNASTNGNVSYVQLYELWQIYQEIANHVIIANWTAIPNDLVGFDQFKGIESNKNCPNLNDFSRPGLTVPGAEHQRFPPRIVYRYQDVLWGNHQSRITCYQDIYQLDDWFWVDGIGYPQVSNASLFPRRFCVVAFVNPGDPQDIYFLARLLGANLIDPFPSPEPTNCNLPPA